MRRVKEGALCNYAVRKLRGNIFSLVSTHIAMRRTENRFRAHGSPSSSASSIESRIVAAGPSVILQIIVSTFVTRSRDFPARYVASTFASYLDF